MKTAIFILIHGSLNENNDDDDDNKALILNLMWNDYMHL